MVAGAALLSLSSLAQAPLPYLRFFVFAQTLYGFGVGGEVGGSVSLFACILLSRRALVVVFCCVGALSFNPFDPLMRPTHRRP